VTVSFEATFPSTPPGVGAMRREVAAFAQRAGMDADGVGSVRLAVSEAATNAVVHAYRGADDGGELTVRAFVGGSELVVIVGDTGLGLAPRPDSPGLGLGLPLMASVTKRFQVVSDGRNGTEIHMAFALPSDA
jgi:anti-sigma regulatory factor (Ser/Thr protein kinase)